MRKSYGFTDWHARNTTRHDLLYSQDPVNIEGIVEKLEDRSPALRYHKTQFNNRLDGADIHINVASRSAEAPDVEAAQKVENVWYALYHELTRPIGENASRAAIDQQVCYGCGVPRLALTEEAVDEIKRQRGTLLSKVRDVVGGEKSKPVTLTKNPFRLVTSNLETVFWQPDRQTFCEIGVRRVSALQRDLDHIQDKPQWLVSSTLPEGGEQPDAKVYHLETKSYIYGVIEKPADDSDRDAWMLEKRENDIGRPWFSLMPGHETSEVNVAERFDPLIGPLYYVVQTLNVLGTLINSGALQTGRNTMQLVADGQKGLKDFNAVYDAMQVGQEPVLRTLTDAAVQHPPDGYHYESMPIPDQEQLIRAFQMQEARLEKWGFPSALSTETATQGSSDTGYKAALQMESAADFLKPALRNRAACWRELFQIAADWAQAQNVEIRIPVQLKAQGQSTKVRQMITLKPGDLREHNVEVEFKSIPATAEYAERESNLRMMQAEVMSVDTFLARHYEDPQLEKKKLVLQMAEKPIIQNTVDMVLAAMAQEAGLLKEEAMDEADVPLGTVPQSGGPAPGETTRRERPPEGAASAGLGATLVNEGQPATAGGAPPSAGIGVTS